MKILYLGNPYFEHHLRRAGATVDRIGRDKEASIRRDPDRVDLYGLIRGMRTRPDVILLTDDLGSRTLPWGLPACPGLKVYYGVDSPLNSFWQDHLADLFDVVALDQKDMAARLSDRLGRPIHWLPVGVEPEPYQPGNDPAQPAERYDIAMVGSVDPAVRPKRSAILDRLARRYRVHAVGARGRGWIGPEESGLIYRRARLGLNENLFPGVTTRMLEIMASRAVLLTEEDSNGLTDLFQPDRHLITYNPDDLEQRIDFFLADKAARTAIAERAHGEVLARHTVAARTEALLAMIEAARGREASRTRDDLSAGWTFLWAGLRWPDRNGQRRLLHGRSLFRRSLAVQSGAGAAYGLGLVLTALGDGEQAGQALSRAAELNRDWTTLLALGLNLFDRGDHSGAEPILDQAYDLARSRLGDPDSAPGPPGTAGFHLAWGRTLTGLGQGLRPGFNRSGLAMVFWTGLEHLVRAAGLAPDRPDCLAAVADLLESRSQYNFAYPYRVKAVELDPDNAEAAARLAACRRAAYLDRP